MPPPVAGIPEARFRNALFRIQERVAERARLRTSDDDDRGTGCLRTRGAGAAAGRGRRALGFLAGVFGIGGGAVLVPVVYECFGLAGVPLEGWWSISRPRRRSALPSPNRSC